MTGITEFSEQTRSGQLRDRADVVIIGSGAAGASAARVFAEAGLDVVIIEEGSRIPVENRPADQWSAFKNSWRDAGFQVARGRMMLPMLQGTAVGGSTVIYGAIIHRIPEPIHTAWSREHGLGNAVPYAELQRIYDVLDRELSVAPPPTEIEGRNNQLMEEAARVGGIRSNKIRRNVVGCKGTSRCTLGCPTAQKQSMDITFIPFAIERGARVYANARAERIATSGDRATGVHARFVDPLTKRPGATLHVEAPIVVVAASAIQTPLLLAQNGIGRRSGLVGRRLQAHPGSSIMGVFDEDVNIWFGATQGHETTHWWDERMKFETVGIPLDVGAARLPGFGPSLMKRIGDWGHVAQWGVQVRAQAHGRVKRGLFGTTSITYDMTNADIACLKLGLKRVARMMFDVGARSILPGIHGLPDEMTDPKGMDALDALPDDPRLFHGIASHMFGTAVMGPDPRGAVVGTDAQSYELKGLYVVDSSVFPTNMGVNPAHTISAMAWWFAEKIVENRRAT